MHTDFSIADCAFAHFAIWTPAGWAHDWQGEVTYTRSMENAALWRSPADAWRIARGINGCVVDIETERLLTIQECLV